MRLIALGENSKIHNQALSKLSFISQNTDIKWKKKTDCGEKKSTALTPKKIFWDFFDLLA